LDPGDHCVFLPHSEFFDGLHHFIGSFVGEGAACISCEVFAKLFIAAFEELDYFVLAGDVGRRDIVAPTGEEIRPILA